MAPFVILLAALAAAAGEPDWFTRVKEQGLEAACRVEVERYERGVLEASHHVGDCYFDLGRWEEGTAVFRRLLRSPDRNYAAAAMARVGEGLWHLGRIEEAKETFARCREEHPDAWFDGSVSERCRAWLEKIGGRLVSPEAPAKEDGGLDDVKDEIRKLNERLQELKALLRKLAEEGKK